MPFRLRHFLYILVSSLVPTSFVVPKFVVVISFQLRVVSIFRCLSRWSYLVATYFLVPIFFLAISSQLQALSIFDCPSRCFDLNFSLPPQVVLFLIRVHFFPSQITACWDRNLLFQIGASTALILERPALHPFSVEAKPNFPHLLFVRPQQTTFLFRLKVQYL